MPRHEHGDDFEAQGEGTDQSTDGQAADSQTSDRKKRIDLSLAQVAGAGVATLTAATAASYLNVYGTVIGTAVMAVLSTSAAPVIQHWITRSGEQAKGLAEKAGRQPGARGSTRSGFVSSGSVGSAVPAADHLLDRDIHRAADTGTDTGNAMDPYGFPAGPGNTDDATRTMAMPVVGLNAPDQTFAHGFGDREDTILPHGLVAPGATEIMPGAGEGPHDSDGGPLDGSLGGPHWLATSAKPAEEARDGSAEGTTEESEEIDERPKRGWRTAVFSAAAVFTLVMLVILAFELLTGRSLTAWTQGQDEPTAPSLFGGESAPALVEDEAPDTTDDGQPEGQQDPGTREPEVEEPVQPEPGTTPGEQQPEAPGRTTDPAEPPVDEGTPEEPGGNEAPGPGPGPAPGPGTGPENGGEGDAPPDVGPDTTG